MFESYISYLGNLPFLSAVIWQNSLADYLVAGVVFTISCLIVYFGKKFFINQLQRFAPYSHNKFDDLILNLLLVVNFPFYFSISLFVASRFLDLNEVIDTNLTRFVILVGYFYLTLGLQRALSSLLEAFTEQEEDNNEDQKKMDRSTADFLRQFLGALIWIAIALIALQNFGYDVSTLMGGLGIAGIAIAFAMQNVLSDIFAYFTINLDKPFKKGDFIIVGGDMGTVKSIGLKNTRIQTLQGQDLIVTNRELTDSRINNYASMSRRRVQVKIAIDYSTSLDRLEEIPQIIEDIVSTQSEATFDRAHLKELGDYSFNFEIIYYLETPGYDVYMDVNQNILLEITRRFRSLNIQMAYPTTVVNVSQPK